MTSFKKMTGAALAVGLLAGAAFAVPKDFTNGNGTGLYRDAANWSPAGVPDLGAIGVNGADTALIDGAYNVSFDASFPAPADFIVNSTFTMGGFSNWSQGNGIGWMQIGSGAGTTGSMVLGGNALFSSGTAQLVIFGRDGGTGSLSISDNAIMSVPAEFGLEAYNSQIDISGGQFSTVNKLIVNNSSMNITGGNHRIGTTSGDWVFSNGSTFYMDAGVATLGPGEFKLDQAHGTLAGGDLDVGFLAMFSGTTGDGILDVLDGTLTFDGSLGFDGFYQAGDAHVNLVAGSTGTIIVENTTAADAYTKYIDSAASRIRANGVSNSPDLVLTEVGADTYITLVPEPASLMLLALGTIALRRRR